MTAQCRTSSLIVLEGIDGAGKTTLARAVAQEMDLTFVSRRTIATRSDYARHQMSSLANLLWHSGDSRDLPPSYWLGLQAAWYSALSEQVIRPELEAGRRVLIDGWLFKFAAKLEVQGFDFESVMITFQAALKPDIVVLLEVAPADVLRRRRPMNPAEQGLYAGYTQLDDASFHTYQSAVLKKLECYAERFDWLRLQVMSGETVADSARMLQALLRHGVPPH